MAKYIAGYKHIGHRNGDEETLHHGVVPATPSPKSKLKRSFSSGKSSSFRKSSSNGILKRDNTHDLDSLHDITDRLEAKVGTINISGRYHRFPRTMDMDYTITSDVLGSGFNGDVRLAKSKERPDHKFAVKGFNFTGVPAQRRVQLESEVEVFLSMDHPHIARLVDVYEKDAQLDLVMECMEGGELLDRIREQKRFSEPSTAEAVWQMLLALNYIHSHGMIHCDLKLENFMYDQKDSNHLKLIDFGFSKMCDKKVEIKRRTCGTLSYTAPEVLDCSYSQQCDQWSLGVIVFVLLAGYMPFSGPESEQVKNIKAGKYAMKEERWATVSEDAKSFTTSLMQVDPKIRLTAEAAMEHPFIANKHFENATHIDVGIVKALRDYGHLSRFRRCCMSMMAWSLPNEERSKVEQYFLALDAKHHGAIYYDDLKKVMVDKFHIPQGEAKRAFNALDSSHHKEIHYSDFLAAMISTRVEMNEELIHEAFRKFDTDDSGYITADNLRLVIGDTFEGVKVEKLLNEADTLHDGKLSYHEFASYLTGKEMHLLGDESAGMVDFDKERGGARPCCCIQ